eukprot:TRINITY_DN58900_c0_g1_i1.p1 TRINITY_DN58900_c0_g1~~TRINITY_DN58900_c0_g1_i1.p1  ORF type:complete len:390 (+),score=50.94 TRINITY_DN58900_c0_g1_i1:59-1171(+)
MNKQPGQPVPTESVPAAKRVCLKSGRIVLNVGSEKFETSRETLSSFPNSYFESLTSGRLSIDVQEDGSIFIDRSPKHFAYILEYLRNGSRFRLPDSLDARDELLLEAEFYGLPGLAAKLRRFKLLDSHYMSCKPKLKNGVVDATFFGALTGPRHAAAIFEVQNPDSFEISFATLDGWDDNFRHGKNMPNMFFGIVPSDSCLSADWEFAPSRLPSHRESPLYNPRLQWSHPRQLAAISACEALWPKQIEVPPAISRGICLALTDSVLQVSVDEADGFLCQLVANGDFEKALDPEHSIWSERPIGWVQMSFARSKNAATLVIQAGEDGGHSQVYAELDLAQLGLDYNAPYRPVVFYGMKASTGIVEGFDHSL